MSMKITFSGNKKIDAEFGGMTIKTDQKKKDGGDESAPAPFSLFLASIGTCAAAYVMEFCASRDIPYENIEISQKMVMNPISKMIGKIELEIKTPADFPPKYHNALIKAANMCAVKKHIETAPFFEVFTSVAD